MDTSLGTKPFEPRSLRGWSLRVAMQVDCAKGGYLTYIFCASALKRQTSFLTFTVIDEHGPEYVALRFRQADLADCESHLDALIQISQVLRTARARDICRALFGDAASTLVGLLSRLGHDPFRQERYRDLIELACRPEHRDRVALLRQVKEITSAKIEIAARLPAALLRSELFAQLHCPDEIDQMTAALDLIRSLNPTATDQDISQSLENLSPQTQLATWITRWLDKAERFPVTPPLPDDSDVMFLSSAAAMRRAALEFRNCLASAKIPVVALGRAAYYVWRNNEAVIELDALSRGHFLLSGVFWPKNRSPDDDTLRAIRLKFEAAGVLVPARYAEARHVNRCAPLLGLFEFGPSLDGNERTLRDILDTV